MPDLKKMLTLEALSAALPSWLKRSAKPDYNADEIDTTLTTNQFVTASDKDNWNAKGSYSKPSGGIPKTDLASAVQTSLEKADSALQSESDPTVPSWAKASTKPSYTASEVGAIATSAKGAASGVAELDANGKVPSSQLPSFVDDVLEYSAKSSFPSTGETGKIYVDTSNNKTYRWSGSAYVEISPSLALGETSSTAYRGDRGKTAYNHSQLTSGNPHNVTKSDVGLGDVGNFKAVSTVASQSLTDTEKSNARANIGAGTSSFSGSYNDLSNKPTLGTASSKDVPSTGNASTSQVVMGNDSRLSDARTPTSHTHTKSDITDFPTSMTPTSHTHGNIQNGGTLQTTDIAIASGDKLVVTDSSNSSKLARTSISFDGSTSTQALTKKGTWETFNNYEHPTNAGNKHIPSGGAANQVLAYGGSSGTAAWTSMPISAYGTCDTAADTAAKTVTLSTGSKFVLTAGAIIAVFCTYTNTAENPTLNVNGTGAKSIVFGTGVITTSNLAYATTANRQHVFMYDGTNYIYLTHNVDNNTTYSNASLGQGYGTCSTAEATAAKVVSLSNYALSTGGIVSVKFTYAVPASATMNINSKGAKAIYYRGTAITAGVIKAGDTATFIYSTYYHLIAIDRDENTQAVTGVKGNSESSYRTGDVNITASNIGLGNVGNFKAVSTVASQGLSDTEKSNARTNIGAGTSSFSGSYNDLSNKPTIPTKTSQLTNDSGYTTNTGTVTQVKVGSTAYNPSSGVVSLPAYPTTLPASDVSSWAKQSSKPTYTASEVGAAASSHTHGNIQNGGTLQTNDITIASGDKLVITDSSDSSKIARASISFDGSTATQALTKKGTWETFNNYSHPTDGANTGSFGPSANVSPGFGGTFSVPYVTVNNKGHVTAASTKTITMPAFTATPYTQPTKHSNITSIDSGGYIQIGKLVIVNMRFTVGTACGQYTDLFTDLPLPLTPLSGGSACIACSSNNNTIMICANGRMQNYDSGSLTAGVYVVSTVYIGQ